VSCAPLGDEGPTNALIVIAGLKLNHGVKLSFALALQLDRLGCDQVIRVEGVLARTDYWPSDYTMLCRKVKVLIAKSSDPHGT
jgi:hypothetical protein